MERLQKYFLTLFAIQIMHSTEEYFFHFYDVFPLIPFMAGFFHSIPQAIFFILNYQLILFLGAVFLISFARERWFFFAVAIFAVIELLNGMTHLSLAIIARGYFPGVASGILFVPASLSIVRELRIKR